MLSEPAHSAATRLHALLEACVGCWRELKWPPRCVDLPAARSISPRARQVLRNSILILQAAALAQMAAMALADHPSDLISQETELLSTQDTLPLAASSAGRVSGKAWKPQKSAAVYVVSLSLELVPHRFHSRSHLQPGVKTKRWEDRMAKTSKDQAIRKLQAELSEEKKAEVARYVP